MSNKKITDLILGDMVEQLTNDLKIETQAKVEAIQTSIEAKLDGLKTELNSSIHTLEAFTTQAPMVVNIGTVHKPKQQVVHNKFMTIIKILQSQKRKEKNIMLVGGAGGGKTHLVGSVASALKLPFYPMSVGLQTTKSDLLGFIDAHGNYHRSVIRTAYEDGGVLLLDEFDAAHAGVVTILNSLLANGHCSFPDGVISKHKDFVCLCACNTYGTGGTIDYVGRNRLDGATLDRFIIVDVDYDNKLEGVLTSNTDWLSIINKIRGNIKSKGIRIILSPRASMDGADLLEAGFTYEEVLDMVVFKGVDKDIQSKLLDGVELPTNTTEPLSQSKTKRKKKSIKAFDIDIELDLQCGWCKLLSKPKGIKDYYDAGKLSFAFSNAYTFYTHLNAQNTEAELWLPLGASKNPKSLHVGNCLGDDQVEKLVNIVENTLSKFSIRITITKRSGEKIECCCGRQGVPVL